MGETDDEPISRQEYRVDKSRFTVVWGTVFQAEGRARAKALRQGLAGGVGRPGRRPGDSMAVSEEQRRWR